jgi:protein SCO1/2
MIRSIVITIFTLLLMPLALYAQPEPTPEQIAARGFDEPPSGGDFTLHSANGPVSLEDYRGKLVLLYFGYTKCPDICPTTMATMTQAANELTPQQAEKVKLVFVSVDSDRDTPESLVEYVSYFHANSIGLTGSKEEIDKVAALYGVQYYKVEMENSSFGYAMNHSGALYLITADGALRFIFPHGVPASVVYDAMLHVISE